MRQYHKALWSLLHFLVIFSVLISLFTGLRIAILEHGYLLQFSNLLPQGELHTLHIFSALVFTLVVVIYVFLKMCGQMYSLSQARTRNVSIRYHLIISRFLYVISSVSLVTGWSLFAENFTFNKSTILFLHYLATLFFVLYFLLHAGVWFIEFGGSIFARLVRPLRHLGSSKLFIVIILVIAPFSWVLMNTVSFHALVVNRIDVNERIEINGDADEPQWQEAEPIRIITHGGANFSNGSTPVTLRALQNGAELFMHIEWDDTSESLSHLPLLKTKTGWRVQQNGFDTFNETQFYEDKLAIILSDSCDFGAAGTAHLGPQPIGNKPKHWAGLGYHYSDEGIVDLWHWKAVRTNHMRLMDDNYIGKPDIVREGSRRYSAGYKTDARESGAYKMNWKWYSPNGIVPKRLPVSGEWLAPYQPGGDIHQAEIPWVLPWFDGMPYSAEKDTYPVGTVLPSILYSSNQFEGDRAHVRAFAKWHSGKWSLELFRKLNTGSSKDVFIRDGLCMWVAAFDHAQIAHTRHVRPIKLSFRP